MAIFLFWIIFSLVIGFLGSGRKIGFGGAFFLSLLLSPLIGLIVTLVSKDKDAEQYKKQVFETQQIQAEVLKSIQERKPINSSQKSITEQLESLQKMKEEGHLTDEDYQKAKNIVISS